MAAVKAVRIVRLGGAAPMGQQAYENELQRALIDAAGSGWAVAERTVLPLRAAWTGRGPGSRPIPLRAAWAASYRAAAAVGRVIYGRTDVVHRLDLRCPPSGRREVVTIHDLPPLRFSDEGSLPGWAAQSARAAGAVICPSQFAADEVRELLGVTRVHVIPYGIDKSRAFARRLSQAELAELGLAGPLVVHAAGATQRKNLELLAAAWPRVVSEHPEAWLALCGPPAKRRTELFAGVPNVRYVGHRPPGFVAQLIRSATAVAVPSVYEGFGLPALEAMVAGTTAVAAACGALPEVAVGSALFAEPTPDAFAAALNQALEGGPEIERLRETGIARAATFSWEKCARETIAVYDAVLG